MTRARIKTEYGEYRIFEMTWYNSVTENTNPLLYLDWTPQGKVRNIIPTYLNSFCFGPFHPSEDINIIFTWGVFLGAGVVATGEWYELLGDGL